MDADGRRDWYRKQQEQTAGTKRHYDDVSHTESHERKAGTELRERDHFKPWWLYKQDGNAGGIADPVLEERWRSAVENRTSDAIFRRGEWCVNQFIGAFRDKLDSDVQVGTSSRTKQIETDEQLKSLSEATNRTLDAWSSTYVPGRSSSYVAAPQVDAAPADHAIPASPFPAIEAALHREVIVHRLSGTACPNARASTKHFPFFIFVFGPAAFSKTSVRPSPPGRPSVLARP